MALTKEDEKVLEEAVELAKGHVAKLQLSLERISDKELHLSVSRTVALREHEIYPFLDSLRAEIGKLDSSEEKTVELGSPLLVFENDIRTRAFVSLDVRKGVARLLEIVGAVDRALKLFSRPAFYSNPRPHVSFAWWNIPAEDGKPQKRVKNESDPPQEIATFGHAIVVPLRYLICKIGKDEFKVNL